MREKDEQWKPAFIGQGTGKPEEDSRRGLFERSEFRSPDDGVACDRLGPITAAALLGSFFSLLRRMNISRHYTRVFPGYRVVARYDCLFVSWRGMT